MILLVISLSAILVASGVQDDNNKTELEEQDLSSDSPGPCDIYIKKYFPESTQELNDIARAESERIAKAVGKGHCKNKYRYKNNTSI